MVASVFGQSAVQIISGANIKSSGGLALEDVEEGGHGERPETQVTHCTGHIGDSFLL